MSDYYILIDGKVVETDRRTRNHWFKDFDNSRIAETYVGVVHISTVFLIVDHGYYGRPLWFETKVFGGTLDQECDRYETLEEAMHGHDRMVAKVKGQVSDE